MLEYGQQDHGRFKSGLGDWNEKIKSGRIQAARAAAGGGPRAAAPDRRHVGLPAAAGRARDALNAGERRESRRRRVLGPLAVALHRAVLGGLALAGRPPRARRAAGRAGPLPARPRLGLRRDDPHDARRSRARWRPARHEVEIVSVLRRRERPFFALPEGVRVRALEDRRAPAGRRRARARPPPEPAGPPRGLRVPVVQPVDRRARCCAACARCAAARWSPPGRRSTCSPPGSRTRR